jgi:hypothetical protein
MTAAGDPPAPRQAGTHPFLPRRAERPDRTTYEDHIMTKNKGGGSFKGHNAKTGAFQPIPPAPQTRRPVGSPVMRIAPRGKSGAKGR